MQHNSAWAYDSGGSRHKSRSQRAWLAGKWGGGGGGSGVGGGGWGGGGR